MDGQRINVQYFYQFWVYVFVEVVIFIQDIGKVVGYFCVKVDVGFFEYVDDVVGYIFVVVVVDVFYYGDGVGVMYGEMFVCVVCGVQMIIGCFVQVGVVDNIGFMVVECRVYWWMNGQQIVCYVFFDVVVGVVSQMQFYVVGVLYVEVLVCGVVKVSDDWVVCQFLVVMGLGDIFGQ